MQWCPNGVLLLFALVSTDRCNDSKQVADTCDMASPSRPPWALHRRSLGALVEDQVESQMLAHRLACIARNVHAGGGEIDLIGRCLDHDEPPLIVFIEVRSRKNLRFGPPAASVNRHKQMHVLRAAAAWLLRSGLYGRCAVRFDVVTVVGSPAGGSTSRLEWITDAFGADHQR